MLLEKSPAMADQSRHDHTHRWSSAIASLDGHVFDTPAYNHGVGGALNNAIDFLYHEWTDNAAGFIGRGHTMGSLRHRGPRLVIAALQVATVRPQLGLSLFADVQDFAQFRPAELQERARTARLRRSRFAWSRTVR